MADWQTMVADILQEVNKPNDSDLADRAIASALRYLRSERFWFNEGTFEIITIKDQFEYAMPTDFVSLIDRPYITWDTSSSRRALLDKTHEFTNDYRHYTWEFNGFSVTNQGVPAAFALVPDSDMPQRSKMVVVPIPDQDGRIIDGRYVRDFGIPLVKYTGSAWTLLDPANETDTVPPTYTSPWFIEGYDLLKNRAIYYMYKRYYRDMEAAQAAVLEYADHFNRLRVEHNRRSAVRTTRGYL